MARSVQIKIVWHKPVIRASQLGLLDDSVTSLQHFDVAGRIELRPAIILDRRKVRQSGEHVDLSQGQRRLADALRLGGNRASQLGKEPALDVDNLLLRVENFGLV